MAEDNSVMRKHHDKKVLPAAGLLTSRAAALRVLNSPTTPTDSELLEIVRTYGTKRYLNTPAESARLAAAKSLLNYHY